MRIDRNAIIWCVKHGATNPLDAYDPHLNEELAKLRLRALAESARKLEKPPRAEISPPAVSPPERRRILKDTIDIASAAPEPPSTLFSPDSRLAPSPPRAPATGDMFGLPHQTFQAEPLRAKRTVADLDAIKQTVKDPTPVWSRREEPFSDLRFPPVEINLPEEAATELPTAQERLSDIGAPPTAPKAPAIPGLPDTVSPAPTLPRSPAAKPPDLVPEDKFKMPPRTTPPKAVDQAIAADPIVTAKRKIDSIKHLLYQDEVITVARDLQAATDSLIKNDPRLRASHPAALLDALHTVYEERLNTTDDPAEQARAALAMAAINLARRYQQHEVIPNFEKLLLALDTNDDKYLDTAEIRAIYNNIAEQTPGMPKLMRPEGFGAWFAELMDQLNTTQKVLLAIGVPLGAIGLASALIRGPDAGSIIMGIGGLGAVLAALTAAGLMPGSRTFDIRQMSAVSTNDVSQIIDEKVADALYLLRTTAKNNNGEAQWLADTLGMRIPLMRPNRRQLTDDEYARGRNMWEAINNGRRLTSLFPSNTPTDIYNAVRALNNKYYYSQADVRLLGSALEGLCYLAATGNADARQYISELGLPAVKPMTQPAKDMASRAEEILRERAGGSARRYIDLVMEQYGIPERALAAAVTDLKGRIQ